MPQTGQTANATRVTRKELERRLHAQEVELRGLSAKLGRFSMPRNHAICSQFPARSRKKRQRLQRVVDAGVGLDESTDAIPYPTGEVPGRGDCQLIDIIGVDKATYNAFAVSPLCLCSSQHADGLLQMCVRDAAVAAGIPKTSRWNNVPPVALGEVLDMVRRRLLIVNC